MGPDCSLLQLSGAAKNVDRFGAATGTLTTTTIGATGALSYLWSDGVTTKDRTGLKAGTYSVTVTDQATLCKVTKSFTLTQPLSALALTGVIANVTTTGGTNGSINVTTSGGTAPYSYKWDDGPITEDRTGLVAGTYAVVVTDSKGCLARTSFTVSGPAVLSMAPKGNPVQPETPLFEASLSPNPTTGVVRLNLYSLAIASAVVNVRDMAGRKVSTSRIALQKGSNNKELNLAGVASGLYHIEVITRSYRKVLKVLVQK